MQGAVSIDISYPQAQLQLIAETQVLSANPLIRLDGDKRTVGNLVTIVLISDGKSWKTPICWGQACREVELSFCVSLIRYKLQPLIVNTLDTAANGAQTRTTGRDREPAQ